MGKIAANIILILIVIFSQLYNSFITAVYQINYNYYATELCENQDKPELHCEGKCYFAKQLALADESRNNTEPPQLLPTLRLFSPSNFEFTPTPVIAIKAETFGDTVNLFPKGPFLSAIEHPPQV